MPLSFVNQTTLEKAPNYFVDENAPAKVAKLNPKMKIIVILRDPIERLLSDYHHDFIQNNEQTRSFGGAVFLDSTGKVNSSYPAVKTSTYVEHIETWLKFFPRSQLLALDEAEFCTNTLTVLQKCERFLKISQFFTEDNIVSDENTGYPCVRRDKVSHPICLSEKVHRYPDEPPQFTTWLRKHYQPYVEKLESVLGTTFSWSVNYKKNTTSTL